MAPDTADEQRVAPLVGDLDDIHRRLVRIHQGLAEPTNADLQKVRPWALGELMALIREVDGQRKIPHGTPVERERGAQRGA